MPVLTVWLLRGSLASLVAGTALGALLLAGAPGMAAAHPPLQQAHQLLVVFGWLVPFVLGTAYWILPRYATAPGRGLPWHARAATVAYAAGLVLRLAATLPGWHRAAAPGTLLLVLGTVGMISLLWWRVRPFGAGRAGP